MEMQQHLPPIKELKRNQFKIDMLFSYEEDNESVLVWCQGTVVDFVKLSKDGKKSTVEIEWNDKCVAPGASKKMKEVLKMSDWNPQTHMAGAWQEDLHHKVLKLKN